MTLASVPILSPERAAEPPRPRAKRWTKQEYNDLVERGAFEGQRIYLFRGMIYEMPPQFHPHAFTVTKLVKALGNAFGLDDAYDIRIQLPFETPGESMPEPDAAVCTGSQILRKPHPNEALLIVEVADSSLRLDRRKALEYAASGAPEYWIVDVRRRRVEVYRAPVADPTAPLGFRYPPPTVVASDGVINPVSRPASSVAVAKLFPPA